MTQRKTNFLKKSGALLATALLTSVFISSQAGETIAKSTGEKPIAEKTPEANPLSFFDGKVTFDFQERIRWEDRDNNFDLNSEVNALTDDNWFLNRIRIGLMLKPTGWLRIYAQAQDSREINSDRPDYPGQLGAEGDDSIDLRQGYIELGNAKNFPLTLKLGRQVLSYGDERLIGAFDWNNISRTFDGVKLRWEEKEWALDAFASTVVLPKRGEYNQSDFVNGTETHRGQVFSGLYFSTTALPFQTTDLYALYLHEDTGPLYQPTAIGNTNFATFGFRAKSKPGYFHHSPASAPDGKSMADGKSAPPPPPPPPPPPAPKPVGFDYAGEFAFQTGEVRGLDLTAFAVNAGLGYTFDVPWLPRLGVEYNYASGDNNPTDSDIETFQNLFPTNHKFYGIMDLTAWQNMQQIMAGVSVQPCKTVTALVDYRAFFIASTDDVWYRANGVTPVRPLTPAARDAGKYEGSQVEIVVTWQPKKYFQLQGGYAHFFAGTYLSDTGPSSDADFGYVQATITF